MKKIFLLTSIVVSFVLFSCDKEDTEIKKYNFLNNVSLTNGRVMFNDVNSLIYLLNNYKKEVVVDSFISHVTSEGKYSSNINYVTANKLKRQKVKSDNNGDYVDYLNGFFANEDNSFQIADKIIKTDFKNQQFIISEVNKGMQKVSIVEDGTNSNINDDVQIISFEELNPELAQYKIRINHWGSCAYCLVAAAAVSSGVVAAAGLFELWTCIDCYNVNRR